MKQPVSTQQRFSPAEKARIVLVSLFLAAMLFIFGILLGLLLKQHGFRLSMLFPERQVMVVSTQVSAAGGSGVPVEISLREVTGAPGEATIRVVAAIRNYGQTALTLSPNNVLLTQPNGRPLALLTIEPRLPRKIKPGETKTFDFTFRRPRSQTATLKIFTIEYKIEMQAISDIPPTAIIQSTSVAPTDSFLMPILPLTPVDSEPIPVNPSSLDMLILAGSLSADQAIVTLDIQLTNQGQNPITLTDADLSVTSENGSPAHPSAVTPSLPQEIPSGESLSISVSFPNPKTPSVMLQILDLTENYPLP